MDESEWQGRNNGPSVLGSVRHQPPAGIRRHDLCGQRQASRKRGFDRARADDKENEGEFGELEGILGHKL